MKTREKLFLLALLAGASIGFVPSVASAAVIYFNGFESGLPVNIDEGMGQSSNGSCTFGGFGGTNRLQSYKGCVSVVPTSSIDAGSGSFVGWADPDQTYGGNTLPGSTIKISPSVGLVDGWKGRYELSFNGFGIRELIFIDEVWAPFGFDADGPAPQDYTSVSPAGTEVSIQGNDYSVKVDLDQRTQYYIDNFGSIYADEALISLCHDNACIFPNWFFAIDSGGWIDNLQLSYLELSHLGTTQGTPIPEPGTFGIFLAGLVVTGILSARPRTC
jgi:hypothetical protein